jgi:hypothetical protein
MRYYSYKVTIKRRGEVTVRERRKTVRVIPPSELSGRVKSSIPARILDISPRGLLVEVRTPLRPSDLCDVTVPTVEGNLTLRAEVRRCRAKSVLEENQPQPAIVYRAGLEFHALTTDETELLEDSIVEVSLSEADPDRGTRIGRGSPIKIQVHSPLEDKQGTG